MATTLPENLKTQTRNRVYTEGVFRTISAPFPHLLRRFSAILCGKGVEKVWRWCGKGSEYILIFREAFIPDPGVIKAFAKKDELIFKKS